MVDNEKTDPLRAKILIVDDDRRLLWAIGTRLEKCGCTCIACSNAIEAMARFAAGGIELVITDMSMPGIDGTGVVGLIRSQSDVPIIVVTAYPEGGRQMADQHEHVTLIPKPFEARTLMAGVRAAILSARKRRSKSA